MAEESVDLVADDVDGAAETKLERSDHIAGAVEYWQDGAERLDTIVSRLAMQYNRCSEFKDVSEVAALAGSNSKLDALVSKVQNAITGKCTKARVQFCRIDNALCELAKLRNDLYELQKVGMELQQQAARVRIEQQKKIQKSVPLVKRVIQYAVNRELSRVDKRVSKLENARVVEYHPQPQPQQRQIQHRAQQHANSNDMLDDQPDQVYDD